MAAQRNPGRAARATPEAPHAAFSYTTTRRYQSESAPKLHAETHPDAVLCSDGDAAFAAFARARGIAHYVINASHGPRVVEGAFHIQSVNQLHAALKDFFRPFRGPATRYLDGYLAWFVARQGKRDP